MILMPGKGVSKGVMKGTLYFFQRHDTAIIKGENCDVEWEKQRIAKAQEAAIEQLTILADKCREENGEESEILFDTHAMFVEDEDYVECIMTTLEDEGCTAEYAVQTAAQEHSSLACLQLWKMLICRLVLLT